MKLSLQNLLLLGLFIISFSMNGQWETMEYVDEFDEPTGETYQAFMAQGTFSNSATQNAKASYALIKNKKSLTIKVYEYGSSLATDIDGTFETVKIKKPDNSVATINRVFFTKKGSLYFSKDNFKEVNNAIKDKGDYIMIFDRTSDYSESNYKIKFTIE